ncbi:MAG: hypothetical protein OXD30_09410, partial [Bryobacterales bacterium]|nr:hypothetical protein [Bryobacterales bacterium]
MGSSRLAELGPAQGANGQLRVLQPASGTDFTAFDDSLGRAGMDPLVASGIGTVQINIGKWCNQTCKHCHVEAGPHRSEEVMSRETFDLCLAAIKRIGRPDVDLTGGAPELNPHFRWFVESARELGCTVIDRCNLTVLVMGSQAGLAEFLARNGVRIIASLPYFLGSRTDAQRGDGVFDKSIRALRKLNELGYGRPGSGLELITLQYIVWKILLLSQECVLCVRC